MIEDETPSRTPTSPEAMADHAPSSNRRWKERQRERKRRREERAARQEPPDEAAETRRRLRLARRGTRNPLDAMRRMARGESFDLPRLSFLSLVQEILHMARDRDAEVAALTLVHACLGTKLLADNPGPDRVLIRDAFVHLAVGRRHWIRRPHEWHPARRDRRTQLSELIRHLLAAYEVPPFFDEAWTVSTEPDFAARARRYQGWFLHVASGANLRTAPDLPFPLSKRVAHHTLEAGADLHIGQALRYGQARALGLDVRLAHAFAVTRAGDAIEAPGGIAGNAFWVSVLRFLAPHGMVDPECVLPIVDYLIHQRFVPARQRDGSMRPPRPNLRMKGRTLEGLLGHVQAWHRRLARVERVRGRSWAPLGVLLHADDAGGMRGRFVHRAGSRRRPTTWILKELLSGRELAREGRALSHCVYSYAWSCERGRSSIWSLRRVRDDEEERRLTVEVRPSTGEIVQIRGLRNRRPEGTEWSILEAFASAASLALPAWLRAADA